MTKIILIERSLILGIGVAIFILTLVSTTMVGCEPEKECKAGALLGSDGICYGPCTNGSYATYTPVGNCSAASAGGVYCCIGGSTGCTPTGCPSSSPWYGCGTCWATSALCNSRGTSNTSDDCSVCRKCP